MAKDQKERVVELVDEADCDHLHATPDMVRFMMSSRRGDTTVYSYYCEGIPTSLMQGMKLTPLEDLPVIIPDYS
jgi:hypothetical protein